MKNNLKLILKVASAVLLCLINISTVYSKENRKIYIHKRVKVCTKEQLIRSGLYKGGLLKFTVDTVPRANDYNFFVSNNGANTNDGKSAAAPKLHIDSIENFFNEFASQNNGASLGLESNSIFREQFSAFSDNVNLGTFNLSTGRRFAKITGMDVIKDWGATPGILNVYKHSLEHSIDLLNPNYNNIIIAEIDTVLEKTNPVSAVKYLTLVASIDQCKTFKGSYYTAPLKENPAIIYIHPTEGEPGKNKYRYEVTTRPYSIDGFYITGAKYENLFLQSSAYGFGMLAAGNKSLVKNVIFQGGGTHHIVIRNGEIDSCLFLPGPRGLSARIAVVFAEIDGSGKTNKISNSIFLDIPNPIYSHTDVSNNYKYLAIDKVYAFADTMDASSAFSASDTDSIHVSNSYAEGYPTGWSGALAKLVFENCLFRNISRSAFEVLQSKSPVCDVNISNVLIAMNGNEKNLVASPEGAAFGIRAPLGNANVEVSNMVFHGFSTWKQPNQTMKVFQTGAKLNARRNIYICDVNDNNALHVYKADNSSGIGSSTNIASDSNVYILLRGSGFHWDVTPNNKNASNIYSLLQWQTLTGQDKNSIFIDLRKNPLGLKAIFSDPLNGNWTLTQTPQADSVRKLAAGMTSPPLYYPKRPTIDNFTHYKTLEGFSSFNGTIKTNNDIELEWKTFNESQFSSFAIEYSMDGVNFMQLDIINALGDEKDNNYLFVDTRQPSEINYYRLRLVNKDNTYSYSSAVFLERDLYDKVKMIVYPNPFFNQITVRHPPRNKAEISIYDFSGNLLNSWQIASGVSKSVLTLDRIQDGYYLVKWSSGQEKMTTTILKSK